MSEPEEHDAILAKMRELEKGSRNPFETVNLSRQKEEEKLLRRVTPHLEAILNRIFGSVWLDEDCFYHPARPGGNTLLIGPTGGYVNGLEHPSGEEYVVDGDIVELWMREHMKIAFPSQSDRFFATKKLNDFLDE